ncbi:hypothetical protein OM076_36525 [Solirubrobacter ginsenosidimutans]|uniref:Uncharacterized protein n=1 Tax=Solirubrobacter ginsenosidimutans TaxID=490573 RepID=A0A9X3N2H9_9ACTN|nr:hypothetical protein [Solirubrobacter ginsenosidimutans]MDA0165830.1 hypothetical protein [Solirubrobacter ginsenosidimutans]
MDPTSPPKDGPYAMWVILAGLTAMTAVTLGALIRYPNPTAIVTALGPVTGIIGTLIGAYFGMRGSSLAQQNANAAEVARITASNPVPAPVPAPVPDAPALTAVTQYDPTANGSGNGNGTLTTSIIDQLRKQDGAHDGDDDPGIDPADMPEDVPPEDEGDDREAHGVTP